MTKSLRDTIVARLRDCSDHCNQELLEPKLLREAADTIVTLTEERAELVRLLEGVMALVPKDGSRSLWNYKDAATFLTRIEE